MKRAVWVCVGLLVVGARSAAAQDSVEKVKALYAAAAYEEALAAAGRLAGSSPRGELEQYRVYCLLALGRDAEAQKAIEALVASDPFFTMDPAETAPRVRQVFNETRQRVLPAIAKQTYTDARAALDRKDRAQAIEQFETLLRILDGTEDGPPSFADMRVLAAGFLDLSRALPAPAPAPAPAAEPVAAVAPPTPPASPSEFRPVAIRQDVPRWNPPDALSRRASYSGAVLVHIGRDGRVESAEIARSVHPSYDQALLRAARAWVYQPAQRNGSPVPADVTVEVSLRPEE